MNEFLESRRYIDSGHPAVIAFSKKNAIGKDHLERAVALYYAVRDGIRYNPFVDFSEDTVFRASRCL